MWQMTMTAAQLSQLRAPTASLLSLQVTLSLHHSRVKSLQDKAGQNTWCMLGCQQIVYLGSSGSTRVADLVPFLLGDSGKLGLLMYLVPQSSVVGILHFSGSHHFLHLCPLVPQLLVHFSHLQHMIIDTISTCSWYI